MLSRTRPEGLLILLARRSNLIVIVNFGLFERYNSVLGASTDLWLIHLFERQKSIVQIGAVLLEHTVRLPGLYDRGRVSEWLPASRWSSGSRDKAFAEHDEV
jgi:hypothetical protein